MIYNNYKTSKRTKAWIRWTLILAFVGLPSSCRAQTHKTSKDTVEVSSTVSANDSVFISRIRLLEIIMSEEERVGTLSYVVREVPTPERQYYIIQVGKVNSYRLEIFYNFYCYTETGVIKLYDPVRDTLIDPIKR